MVTLLETHTLPEGLDDKFPHARDILLVASMLVSRMMILMANEIFNTFTLCEQIVPDKHPQHNYYNRFNFDKTKIRTSDKQ